MKPSPEAIAWGKRQASQSPRWSDTKWSKIGTIFGVQLLVPDDTGHQPEEPDQQQGQEDAEPLRDAA